MAVIPEKPTILFSQDPCKIYFETKFNNRKKLKFKYLYQYVSER